MTQGSLFDDLPEPPPANLPEGLDYEAEFLSRDEEQSLIALIRTLPLQAAKYKQYTARRRVVSFGGSYDFDSNELLPAQPLIDELHPLRARVARWAGVPAEALHHVLMAEYAPGTPLGWHRDVPDHEAVFGVSLGSTAVLRLRPYPPVAPRREDVVKLRAAPALRLRDVRPGPLGLAAQRGAGGRTALVDHAAHGAAACGPLETARVARERHR